MRRMVLVLAALALLVGACGDGGAGSASAALEGGAERTVLVDFRHDEFASAFLRYYPETVTVRPGDAVRFKQAWTGEPHSVTMGKVVDGIFEAEDLFMKYDSPEEALADGVPQERIDDVLGSLARVPGMTGEDHFELYQPGAQPCYVADIDDVPQFSNPQTEEIDEDAECPTAGSEQPRFDGRQALYNSGFIPAEGKGANEFALPIAADAEPGTYRYYCNYHWTSMSGTVEIVGEGADIPSQQEVSRTAREEIEADAKVALQKIEEAEAARGGKVGDLELPLAGREADEDFAVIINEFLPNKIEAEVGEEVTWTFDGISHTVSFNVPKYFPVFTVDDDGTVEWNPQSYEPVAWDVPPPDDEAGGPEEEGGGPEDEREPEPRRVDVGEWDGAGGFHSSGALDPGETFTVTFTKPGTYLYACVLHPQMVGTLEVAS